MPYAYNYIQVHHVGVLVAAFLGNRLTWAIWDMASALTLREAQIFTRQKYANTSRADRLCVKLGAPKSAADDEDINIRHWGSSNQAVLELIQAGGLAAGPA